MMALYAFHTSLGGQPIFGRTCGARHDDAVDARFVESFGKNRAVGHEPRGAGFLIIVPNRVLNPVSNRVLSGGHSIRAQMGEVYVCPFPELNKGKWQVPAGRGEIPLWSPDGRELFYRNADSVMAVKVQTANSVSPSLPRKTGSKKMREIRQNPGMYT